MNLEGQINENSVLVALKSIYSDLKCVFWQRWQENVMFRYLVLVTLQAMVKKFENVKSIEEGPFTNEHVFILNFDAEIQRKLT